MSPLEAVARAICAAVQAPHEHPDVTDSEWPLWEDEAHAAIAALRDCAPSDAVFDAMVEGRWRAMLDAVLEEG